MPAPDYLAAERQMYLDMLGWAVDDPSYSMGDLRNMTAGGANAHRSVVSGNSEAGASSLFVTKDSLFVNVRDYGAKGDGVTDDTVAFNSAASVYSSAGELVVYVPKGVYIINGTINLPTGCELRGAGRKASVLKTALDKTTISIIGGEGQVIRDLKIDNRGFTGTRTTYDISICNPFHPLIENVEVALSQTSRQKGGINIYRDELLPYSNWFMPVLNNILIRNGVLRIADVTDVKVQGGWVWGTYTEAPGAVELAGASNCSFKDLDIVPSVNAGYLVSGHLSNLSIVGGLMDGNGDPSIHPGPGFKNTDYIRGLTIMAVKFWKLWQQAIVLNDVRNATIMGNQFASNNREDNSWADIDVTAGQAIAIVGNGFSAPDVRVNKGKAYTENNTSTDNIVDYNTMEYNGGAHYYLLPLVTVRNGSTLGKSNRPDVVWPFITLAVKAANYTILKEDIFNGYYFYGSATLAFTLPSAGSIHSGNTVTIKNTGTGTVTINTVSAQTIDGGGTTMNLAANQAVTLQSDSANWEIVSSYGI